MHKSTVRDSQSESSLLPSCCGSPDDSDALARKITRGAECDCAAAQRAPGRTIDCADCSVAPPPFQSFVRFRQPMRRVSFTWSGSIRFFSIRGKQKNNLKVFHTVIFALWLL